MHGHVTVVHLPTLNAVARHNFGLVGTFLAGATALLANLTFALRTSFFFTCTVITARGCGFGCAVLGTTFSGCSGCFVRAASLCAFSRLRCAGFFVGRSFFCTGRLLGLFVTAAGLWRFLS